MMQRGGTRWRAGVDVGGTFADCVAVSNTGDVRRLKLLSSGARRVRVVAAAGTDSPDGSNALVVEGLPAWCLPALPGCVARGPGALGGATVQAAEPVEPRPAAVEGLHSVSAPPYTRLLLDRGLAGARCVELGTEEEAPVWGVRLLTGTPLGSALPLDTLHLSTTRGTNALLEGGRAPIGLVCNAGLEGVVAIGTQQRLGIFDLVARAPPLLADVVLGVSARLAADGSILDSVDRQEVLDCAQRLHAQGVGRVAVALMHSWRDPSQENAVAALLREAGIAFVVTSAELSSVPRLEPRARTAVIEARLHEPVLGYLGGIGRRLGSTRLLVGTSAGAVTPLSIYRAKDSLLSGPAAGCHGAAQALGHLGIAHAMTFDMGGTSTDVARITPHGVALRLETVVADRVVASPSVEVHSVAAGGGSICTATAEGLFVGPQSAGALPGPACYGHGGPLTLTDVNLLLGRLWPGLASLPLAVEPARHAAEAAARASGRPMAAMLRGFLEVAHEHMAAAIRTVTTGAGHDPREHLLLAFGGAGGQHACAVAERLGMTRVNVPPNAGFMSAEGVLGAAPEQDAAVAVMAPLADGCALDAAVRHAAAVATAMMEANGGTTGATLMRIVAALRATGRSGLVTVDAPTNASAAERASHLRAAFGDRLRAMADPAHASEPDVESVRVWVRSGENTPPLQVGVLAAAGRPSSPRTPVVPQTPAPLGMTRFGAFRDSFALPGSAGDDARPGDGGSPDDGTPCPVFAWSDLQPGCPIHGPALVLGEGATIVVEPGWTAAMDPLGGVNLLRAASPAGEHGPAHARRTPQDEAVDLEVAAARFVAIGAWMGTCLERSAWSVNVKERLDFSCGILNAQGMLIANAPHIPVHLGALGACARSMLSCVELGPEDAALTNDPRHGGSHLPDLTLLKPVDAPDGTRLGFVAARAHHAEIGGSVPGSMPPMARTLAEEGVLIPPLVVLRNGVLDEALLRQTLASGPWPSRAPETNIADIRAALAALDAGARALQALAEERGTMAVRAAMERLTARSAAHVRTLVERLPAERVLVSDVCMDDGWRIQVRVERGAPGRMRVRVETDGVHPGNFNAPLSVTRSALLYVLRVLAGHAAPDGLDDHRAPLNEGFLEPVDLEVTPGFLNPFSDPACLHRTAAALPAVFAGNTESSQRLVEALLGAFNVAACSQGTMNNLVLGNAGFSLYETLGGGAGASNGLAGASAVHVHMSNTRLTDPETLEIRHPVRVEVLQVRAGSGGTGLSPGGCGMVRRLRMLEPVGVCFVSQHRTDPPPGCAGGGPGACGAQRVLRAGGAEEEMPGVFEAHLRAGDAVEIRTPGGGGYGAPWA